MSLSNLLYNTIIENPNSRVKILLLLDTVLLLREDRYVDEKHYQYCLDIAPTLVYDDSLFAYKFSVGCFLPFEKCNYSENSMLDVNILDKDVYITSKYDYFILTRAYINRDHEACIPYWSMVDHSQHNEPKQILYDRVWKVIGPEFKRRFNKSSSNC